MRTRRSTELPIEGANDENSPPGVPVMRQRIVEEIARSVKRGKL